MTVTPSTLAFGKITVGTPSSPQLVTVVNTGTVAINFLQSPAFPYISEPTDPGSIKITNQTCGATLAAGANCSFDVAFAPSKNESIGGAIALFDNAPSTPQVITLSGQGQVPTVPGMITPSTLPTPGQVGVPISTVAFNVNGVPSGTSVEVLTQNSGMLPPGLILNEYPLPFSLFGTPEQSGSFTFTVTAIDTNGDTGSQTYTVNVAPNPVEITLSPSFVSVPAGGTVQFSATVTGTTNTGVNWSVSPFPTGGTISTTGLYQAPATAITGTIFVTATSQASSGITAFASVTVTAATTKSTPTITWPAPTAISYGTALSATQLDATASVPGTFSYSPSSGTILNGGTFTLSVTFTPTNTTIYNTATASVLLLVNPVAPTITWPTPAAITYGTALGSTQLDATASVPGSFAYSPVSRNDSNRRVDNTERDIHSDEYCELQVRHRNRLSRGEPGDAGNYVANARRDHRWDHRYPRLSGRHCHRSGHVHVFASARYGARHARHAESRPSRSLPPIPSTTSPRPPALASP